jgi:hypothetical protein
MTVINPYGLKPYLVAFCGTQMLGNDVEGGIRVIDKGFWDLDQVDPNTCGAVEIAAPIGPWATCESYFTSHLSSVLNLSPSPATDPNEETRLKQIGELWLKSVNVGTNLQLEHS